MNENTEQLIRELATKFGTTSEHLWGVMLRQAPLSGAMDLVGLLIVTVSLIFAIKYLRKLFILCTEDDDYIPAVVCVLAVAIVLAILVIGCIASLGVTLAAFFNPEYWALKQIIK